MNSVRVNPTPEFGIKENRNAWLGSPTVSMIFYRKARTGEADTVPGLQTAYEPPEKPEFVADGVRELPETAARRLMIKLAEKGYICDD